MTFGQVKHDLHFFCFWNLISVNPLMCLCLWSVLTSHRGGGVEVLISCNWPQLRLQVSLWVKSVWGSVCRRDLGVVGPYTENTFPFTILLWANFWFVNTLGKTERLDFKARAGHLDWPFNPTENRRGVKQGAVCVRWLWPAVSRLALS